MIILVNHITPRLEYTFDFVFRETLKLEYQFVIDPNTIGNKAGEIIWGYGVQKESIAYLPSVKLLFENNISPQRLMKIQSESITPIFKTEDGEGFDIFASIFYLISRYEEYLPCVQDVHGRYASYQSVAVNFDFIEKAMVNRYIAWIRNWLLIKFPSMEIHAPHPSVLFSFDIDHPFYSKDIPLQQWIKRSIKNKSLFRKKDRYDTFEFILESLAERPSIFFFLCPKNPTEMDHLHRRESESFKNLFQYIKTQAKIGIHPSYYAEENGQMKEEIEWLSQQHQRPIKSSRYHYLRSHIETSYLELSRHGIQYDFSMMYGDRSGFRSGTSLPYYYFDLKKNKKTGVLIHTPCIMDSTFEYNYEDGFEEKYLALYHEVRNFGGIFLPIFHNDILSKEEWQERFKNAVLLN